MNKKRQFIITVIVLAVIGALIAFISTNFIRDKMIKSLIVEEEQSQLILAQQIAHLLETELSSIQEKVSLIAQFPQIQDGNSELCNKKLTEVSEQIKSQVDNITRFNTKLVLDCAINQKSLGYTLTPESPITALIKDQTHPPYLSYSGFSPVSNQEVLYLNVPVYSSKGDYSGIIGGVIYLNYIGDKYLKHITFGEGEYITLLDDNGSLLYHPDNKFVGKKFDSPELLAWTHSNLTFTDLNKKILEDSKKNNGGIIRGNFLEKEMLVIWAPAHIFPNRTWSVVLTVPIENIIAKIEKNEKFGGLNLFVSLYSSIFIVFILFSFLILFLLIRGIFVPLQIVRDIMNKIGQGQLDITINQKLLGRHDEFGDLLTSADKMAAQLKTYYHQLEQKVKERTEQLDRNNAELKKTNDLMVGRELKMIELKKEVAELKNKKL